MRQTASASALKHYAVNAPDEVFLRLVDLALSCVAMPTISRPSMAVVVTELESAMREVYGVQAPRHQQAVDERLRERADSHSISMSQELDNIGMSDASSSSSFAAMKKWFS